MENKQLVLHHTSITMTGSTLAELVRNGKPITGDFTTLYQGVYESFKCYKGGIILFHEGKIFSADGTIEPTEVNDNWDVFYNGVGARIVIKEGNELLLLSETGKEHFVSLPEDTVQWGLSDSGVLIYNDELTQLKHVDFVKGEEQILFSSDSSFHWAPGWQGAIIESNEEIFYCCPGYKERIASKAEDKYIEWSVNQSSPIPAILLVTQECLVYVRHKCNGGEMHHSLTNDYDDFKECKEGTLLSHQGSWKYLPYDGSATELPVVTTEKVEIYPHPYGVLIANKGKIVLVFL